MEEEEVMEECLFIERQGRSAKKKRTGDVEEEEGCIGYFLRCRGYQLPFLTPSRQTFPQSFLLPLSHTSPPTISTYSPLNLTSASHHQ